MTLRACADCQHENVKAYISEVVQTQQRCMQEAQNLKAAAQQSYGLCIIVISSNGRQC